MEGKSIVFFPQGSLIGMRDWRLERRLLRLLGSAPGFLSIGLTAAVLRGKGTIPVVREEWITCVMRGAREGMVALTKAVGRGSNWQVDDLGFLIQKFL